jgi:hypothetical protein
MTISPPRKLSAEEWCVEVNGLAVTLTERDAKSPRLLQLRIAEKANVVAPMRLLKQLVLNHARQEKSK